MAYVTFEKSSASLYLSATLSCLSLSLLPVSFCVCLFFHCFLIQSDNLFAIRQLSSRSSQLNGIDKASVASRILSCHTDNLAGSTASCHACFPAASQAFNLIKSTQGIHFYQSQLWLIRVKRFGGYYARRTHFIFICAFSGQTTANLTCQDISRGRVERGRTKQAHKDVMYIKCTREDSIHISERFAFISRPTKRMKPPEAATCEEF